MSGEPIVWLVEREFIFDRKFVPVASLPPSASKRDAEMKRDTLPNPELYRVAKYRRVSEEKP